MFKDRFDENTLSLIKQVQIITRMMQYVVAEGKVPN